MKKILNLAFVLLVFTSVIAYGQGVEIVNNAKSKYVIIIPKAASEEEKSAANLLQDGINKTTGAKLMIFDDTYPRQEEEILIGKARGLKVGDVGINKKHSSYEMSGKKLVFNGASSYYSVIDFLERELGVRKFTTDCEIYPKKKVFSVKNNLKYSFTSPNTFRQVNSTFTRRDKNFARWLKTELYQETFASGYYVHTASKLCPPKKYFSSHPEYFSYVNGQRITDQICWSNDTVYQIVKSNLAKAMLEQPGKDWWSVSQNDNNSYCQCPRCKALIDKEGSPAAPIIKFVNRIAKEFPDKIISTLAYQYSRKCPKTLKPEKNVQIMLCTIESNRNITIEEEKARLGKKSFAQDLEDWGKVSKNIYLWDYECDFAYYTSPFPNFHVLQPNIQYFVNNGSAMQFQQANCQRGNDFSELKNYLIAKLLWNPKMNQDSIITEFVKNYYGPAGLKVKEYLYNIDSVAISYKDKVSLGIYETPTRYADNILSKENLSRYDSIMQVAEEIAKTNKIYLQRVQTVRLALDYAMMEIAKADMYGERGWYYKDKGKWILKADLKDRLEKFYKVANKVGVEVMNESGLKVANYYKATLRFIDSDVQDDVAFQKKVTANPMPSKNYSKGDPNAMTNGVKGTDDYKSNWLGWWGDDFTLVVDLEKVVKDKTVIISSLDCAKSWILHPNKVKCLVSTDGKNYKEVETQLYDGAKKNNPTIKEFTFKVKGNFRYVKFEVEGTHTLPSWHPSYTKKSWVFMDEIIVK